MKDTVAGFDWDAGNLEKCRKHGVSRAEIEALFLNPPAVFMDDRHSASEKRFKAAGKGHANRMIFLVFTLRSRSGRTYIRPISARYMHKKEVQRYEKEISGLQN